MKEGECDSEGEEAADGKADVDESRIFLGECSKAEEAGASGSSSGRLEEEGSEPGKTEESTGLAGHKPRLHAKGKRVNLQEGATKEADRERAQFDPSFHIFGSLRRNEEPRNQHWLIPELVEELANVVVVGNRETT